MNGTAARPNDTEATRIRYPIPSLYLNLEPSMQTSKTSLGTALCAVEAIQFAKTLQPRAPQPLYWMFHFWLLLGSFKLLLLTMTWRDSDGGTREPRNEAKIGCGRYVGNHDPPRILLSRRARADTHTDKRIERSCRADRGSPSRP